MPTPTQKAVVLLDGMFLQNILTVFNLSGKVDYEKLTNKLAGADFFRARTYVFDALPYEGSSTRQDKQRFLDKLKYLSRFQVDMGYVKMEHRICGCPVCKKNIEVTVPRQKKVDVLLATRLLECALNQKIDKIVIVAGDADFVPAIAIAKKQTQIALAFASVHIKASAHTKAIDVDASTELKTACDDRILMDKKYFDDCKL